MVGFQWLVCLATICSLILSGGRLGDDLSALLRTGVSTTMRHVSIPYFLSKDLPLRLEPFMKGPAF